MDDITRTSYQTEANFVEDKKSEVIEDKIINSFIEQDVGIVIEPETSFASPYGQGSQKEKDVYNMMAFRAYSDAYEEMRTDHPRLKNIDFSNFVKIYNPSNDYLTYLRTPNPDKNSPAYLWAETFKEDTGSFRVAALEGYKLKLEAMQTTDRKEHVQY